MSKSKTLTPDVLPTESAEVGKHKRQKTDERRAEALQYKLSGVELESILFACDYSHENFAKKYLSLYRSYENPDVVITKQHLATVKQILSSTKEASPRAIWVVAQIVHKDNFQRLANHIINNESRIVPFSLEEQVMSRIQEKGATA